MAGRRILVWFWSGGGGGSAFAVRLAYRLQLEFGADRVALSMRSDDPTIARARGLGLHVLEANIVSDRKRPLQSVAALATSASVLHAHVRQSGADVVCAAMNFAIAAPLSLVIERPLIYCAHDPEPHAGDYAATGQRVTQATLVARAATVVALSQFAAARLQQLGVPAAKIRAAPLASVFEPTATPKPARQGPVRLLFLGRMIRYKGIDLLADALERLRDRADWRLRIAGLGPALTDEALGRFGPSAELVTRQAMTEQEVELLMATSDVLLAPYLGASQSGVAAQGLSAGLPVVATPVGALPEQLAGGESGWIAEQATAAAFAAALGQALDSPEERAAKAERALALARAAWAGDYWSWIGRVGPDA